MHRVLALVACFVIGYLIWSTVAALAYLGKADRETTRTFAELQRVNYVNLHDLAKSLRVILLPGEMLSLRIVREGKDKGQGIGYLPDGTMVVVNNGQASVGQQVEVQVQSQLQTGAGVIVFADLKSAIPA